MRFFLLNSQASRRCKPADEESSWFRPQLSSLSCRQARDPEQVLSCSGYPFYAQGCVASTACRHVDGAARCVGITVRRRTEGRDSWQTPDCRPVSVYIGGGDMVRGNALVFVARRQAATQGNQVPCCYNECGQASNSKEARQRCRR